MTTFAGQLSGSMVDVEADAVSTNIASDDGVQILDAFLQAQVADSGSITDNLPISMPASTIAGSRGKSGAGTDDWYYRFHIIPTAVDAGNVLIDTTLTFKVWNGWLTSKTVGAIAADGDTTGLVLSPPSPYVVPYVIAGIEEQDYTIAVSVNGPSLIDVTYSFAFSTGENIDLLVTGQRIFAWTFRPNWSEQIEERMEWATDVLTSYNGTEQRIALRTNPRRTMAYGFTIDNNSDRRKFEAMLFNWGARIWLVPIWMEGNTLTAELAAGATSMTVPRVDGNWHDGGYLIMMAGAFDFEIIKVSTVSGNTVNFNDPTDTTWPAGTMYYPAVTGILPDKLGLSRFTGSTMYGKCQFMIFETETVAADSPTTYRTLPVVTQAPHWQQDITSDYQRKLRQVDYMIGKFAVDDEAGMPFNIISHHWTCDGKDEIDGLREFIYSLQGKQKAVWLPTFAPDIELVENVGSTSPYLDVAHGYIVQHLWGHKNRRDIMIELVDGTVFYRRLTNADESSDTVERLTMESPLGTAITPDDVLRISWMNVARLDTDSISFVWRHDDWVDCSVNWRTVRDDV